MGSISETRAALVDAISPVVRAFAYMPANLPTPCVIVGFPSSYNPNDALGDTATITIPVNLYVPYGSNRSAEDNLEAYLTTSGSGSLLDAIEDAGDNFGIVSVRDFGVLENTQGTPTALGCTIDVIVYT